MQIELSEDGKQNYYELVINRDNIRKLKKSGKWRGKKEPLSEVNRLCKKYFFRTLKEMMFLSLVEIDEIENILMRKTQKEKDEIIDLFKKIKYKKKDSKGIVKEVQGDYISDVLYKTMEREARKIVFENSGFKTCPYCNRNYVNMVYKSNTKKYYSTFELDHFRNKANYPFLALSVNNLVPVCPPCNRIKGEKVFGVNPYESLNYDEYKFKYLIQNTVIASEEDIELEIEFKNPSMKKQMQALYLEELYDNHKDIAIEIINKTRNYNTTYGKGVLNNLKGLYKDWEEIYRMIFGTYLNQNDWNKRPLSKFTYDIYEDTLKNL